MSTILTILYLILRGVYKIGVSLYNFLINLAVGGNDALNFNINGIVENAYILVGTFMVFRIIITLLQMIVDPDKVSDKQVGAGKMLSRIVISFILLISFNTMYDFLIDRVQPAIIGPDGFITNFVDVNYNLDPIDSNNKDVSKYENESPGYVIVGSVFSSLITMYKDTVRTIVSTVSLDKLNLLKSAFSLTINEDICRDAKDNGKNYQDSDYDAMKKQDSSLKYTPGLGGGALLYDASVNSKKGFLCVSNGYYDINFLINIVVGLALVVFIFVMCIEVVVRNLKLIVLRIIAPIAFISYLNPKDKIFSQWLKSFASVYFDLFLKLFSISLATTIITANGDKLSHELELLSMILGILTFAKILPSFISKIFGISGSGSFKESFAMAKKGFGAATAGVAAATVGGVSKAVATASNIQKGQKGRILKTATSALTGGFSAGASGARDGWKGKGSSAARSAAITKSQAYGDLLSATGGKSNFMKMMKNRTAAKFGIATEGEKVKAKLEQADNVSKNIKDLNDEALAEADKDQKTLTRLSGKNFNKTIAAETTKTFNVSELIALKNSGVAKVNVEGAGVKNIDDVISSGIPAELVATSLNDNSNQFANKTEIAAQNGTDVTTKMTFGIDANGNAAGTDYEVNISAADAKTATSILRKQAATDIIASDTNEVVKNKKKKADDSIDNDLSGLFADEDALKTIGDQLGIKINSKDDLKNELAKDASLYSKVKDAMNIFKNSRENSAENIAAQKVDEYNKKTSK